MDEWLAGGWSDSDCDTQKSILDHECEGHGLAYTAPKGRTGTRK
jgi:hypothetical protein